MKKLITVLVASASIVFGLSSTSVAQPMMPMGAAGGADQEPTGTPTRLTGASPTARGGQCGANGARRCGLNGNLLIEDHDDVFMFPQKAHSNYNVNLVRLDTDGEAAQGTFFSKTNRGGAWGIGVSHAPIVDGASADQPGIPAFQLLDVFYSGGGSKAWGIRASIANGGNVNSQGAPDASNLNFGLAAGYSTKGSFAMDLGGKLHYTGITIDDVGTASIVDFTANFRGYMKNFSKKLDLGIIAQLNYAAIGFAGDNGNPDVAQSIIGVKAGGGPVYRLGDSTVSLYGLLKIRNQTDAEAESTILDIVIPEVNLAFETPINDWLVFRGGIGYNFIVSTFTPDGPDPEGIKANNFDGEVLDEGGATSSIGLAGRWDDLTLDVAVNKAWLTSGPHFLSGGSVEGGWASKAAVTYNW